MEHKLNIKFIEILANLVYQQNVQLLQILAEKENISYRDLVTLIPSPYHIKKSLNLFATQRSSETQRSGETQRSSETQRSGNGPIKDGVLPLEKSNSISESSVSSSEPDVE